VPFYLWQITVHWPIEDAATNLNWVCHGFNIKWSFGDLLTKPILSPELWFVYMLLNGTKLFLHLHLITEQLGTEFWGIFRKVPNKIKFVDSRMVLISSADLTFNLNIHNHIQ
jgi:hypothetical protein